MPPTRPAIRISWNAPFVLGYAGLALFAILLHSFSGGQTSLRVFSLPGSFEFANPFWYPRLILHAAGHVDWAHFFANFTLILLIGPLLEEKYGSWNLARFSLITAAITGVVHIIISDKLLIGASGVAFMMILLTSLANFRRHTLPVTFIIVALFYLGHEIIGALRENDQISQVSHIAGGICGAAIGFWWANRD